MKTVSTRLPEEWAKALDEIATEEHTTRSQLVRDMLMSFARSYQSDRDETMEKFLGDTPSRPGQIDILEHFDTEVEE